MMRVERTCPECGTVSCQRITNKKPYCYGTDVTTEPLRSTVPAAADPGRCPSCGERLPFHTDSCPLRRASYAARVAEAWTAYSQALALATEDHRRRVDGSSSTTTGSTHSRGMSVTGLSSLACRRLKRMRCAAISTSDRSQRGMDTGRTLDLSRRLSAEADITGMAQAAEMTP
jgi:hypothetical protein